MDLQQTFKQVVQESFSKETFRILSDTLGRILILPVYWDSIEDGVVITIHVCIIWTGCLRAPRQSMIFGEVAETISWHLCSKTKSFFIIFLRYLLRHGLFRMIWRYMVNTMKENIMPIWTTMFGQNCWFEAKTICPCFPFKKKRRDWFSDELVV